MFKIKNLGIGVTAVMLSMTLSSGVFAGLKGGGNGSPGVTVTDAGAGQFLVFGYIGQARNSTNTVEYIHCYSGSGSGGCVAVNAAGLTKSCMTSNPEHVAAIQSVGESSYITLLSKNSICEILSVSNGSPYEIKK